MGHRAVISALCDVARDRGEESMVVTFWPHPRMVLQQDAEALRLLTSLSEKKEMLYGLGVGRVEVLDFTQEFSRLTAGEFMKEYLMDRYGCTALILGYDHRLGGRPAMSREGLERLAGSLGMETFRMGEEDFDGVAISSTVIRNLLREGDVAKANEMLGYRYGLHGVVVSGNKIGRDIGFPTANMELYEPLKLLPADGVYAVEADVSGRTYYGMTNIGTRPTVSALSKRTVETNIFGFSSDIYGLDMKLRFVSRIRGEIRFDTVGGLQRRLIDDKAAAERIFNINGK